MNRIKSPFMDVRFPTNDLSTVELPDMNHDVEWDITLEYVLLFCFCRGFITVLYTTVQLFPGLMSSLKFKKKVLTNYAFYFEIT